MVTLLVAALPFLLAAAPAKPAAKGTISLGAPFAFQDAVAHRKTDWEGPKVVVVFFERPVDRAALLSLDVEGAVEAAKGEDSWIELAFTPDGAWSKLDYLLRREGGSSSGTKYDPAFAPTMKATVQGGQVGGRVRADFGSGEGLDLTLAVPIVEPPAGTALPQDGGEPGKALQSCSAAFAGKKIKDVERLCSADLAADVSMTLSMKANGMEVDDPWTRKGRAECEVAAVAGLTLEGGVTAGDEALIRATGGWEDEGRCAGDVFLRRADGVWQVKASRLARLP